MPVMITRFLTYELDSARFSLCENGEPVAIQPLALAILILLVENHHRMVTKNEIIERVWSGRIVSDTSLSTQVKALRRILSDDGNKQRVIQTVYGQGLRFIADVKTGPADRAALSAGNKVKGPPGSNVSGISSLNERAGNCRAALSPC